jgi:hypothetical protein
METHLASGVDLCADLDYGEGYISFRWPDPLLGEERLTITLEGFFSKSMPFYSDGEYPNAVTLLRDRIRFCFSDSMARNLRLEPEFEIMFSISDDCFLELQQVINYIFGSETNDDNAILQSPPRA